MVEKSRENWLEEYCAETIEALPEAVRHRFDRLLRAAAISQEGFRGLTKQDLEISLFPSSDNPRKQLEHIVAHAYANIEVIAAATDEEPGRLETYDYAKQFPEIAAFSGKTREELLLILGQSLGRLHSLLQEEGILARKIQKPYKLPINVLDAVGDLSEHFYLHAQNMIDYYEKHGIQRSVSMKAALG